MFYRSKIIIEDFYEPVVWSEQPRYTPRGRGAPLENQTLKGLEYQLNVHNISQNFSTKNSKTSTVGETKENRWIEQIAKRKCIQNRKIK